MKILFDAGTPVGLRRHLRPHLVDRAQELGWATVKNGELLDLAEAHGYDVLLTTDQNIEHQQRLGERRIAILAVPANWRRIAQHIGEIVDTLRVLSPGAQKTLRWPRAKGGPPRPTKPRGDSGPVP